MRLQPCNPWPDLASDRGGETLQNLPRRPSVRRYPPDIPPSQRKPRTGRGDAKKGNNILDAPDRWSGNANRREVITLASLAYWRSQLRSAQARLRLDRLRFLAELRKADRKRQELLRKAMQELGRRERRLSNPGPGEHIPKLHALCQPSIMVLLAGANVAALGRPLFILGR